jgi:hypothetical protein
MHPSVECINDSGRLMQDTPNDPSSDRIYVAYLARSSAAKLWAIKCLLRYMEARSDSSENATSRPWCEQKGHACNAVEEPCRCNTISPCKLIARRQCDSTTSYFDFDVNRNDLAVLATAQDRLCLIVHRKLNLQVLTSPTAYLLTAHQWRFRVSSNA